MYDDYNWPYWINSHKLLDTLGGGIWTFTFPREDIILDSTETLMNSWRGLDSIPVDAMLDAEEYFAEMAYNSLDSVFGIYVGLEPLAENRGFKIYPNPATNQFSIVTEKGIEVTLIEIIDIRAKVVMHQKVSNNNESYNINQLPDGLYFVRIHTNQGVEVQKLVIQ